MAENNRREFIAKCGAGLAGIMAAGKAPAAIVRSLVAANGMGFAGDASGWKNPYVTNGLIAMWDGEWNAGPGKHDPDATIWKDLVGNRDFTLVAGATWRDDSIEKLAGANGFAQRSGSMTYSTLELVFMRTGGNIAVFSVNNPIYNVWVAGNPPSFRTGRTSGRTGRLIPQILNDVAYHIAFTYIDGYDATAYKNGSAIENINSPDYYNFAFSVGGFNIERYMNGRFYSIRIYDRTLTADEIAHNYAIDKERFNLP